MDLLNAFKSVTEWGSAEGHPADLFDRLTYRVTSFIIMILVALIGIKSYIFKPIQCTLTESYTSAPAGFEEYAENMCWIENVFRLSRIDVKTTYDETTYKGLDYDLRSKIRMLCLFSCNSSLVFLLCACTHWVRHGFKIGGGGKSIIELESELKFNINLYKII